MNAALKKNIDEVLKLAFKEDSTKKDITSSLLLSNKKISAVIKFKEKGIMALLGSGFDPGVTNVFTAFARKHHLDSIDFLDILDCNDGDHGHPFATNFNPEINIREVTSDSKHWENNKWEIGPALKKKVSFKFPEIGNKNMYLMYHEELESLIKYFPEIKRARFWMTFGDQYLNYLNVSVSYTHLTLPTKA
mgnify:CR=1 FL=1